MRSLFSVGCWIIAVAAGWLPAITDSFEARADTIGDAVGQPRWIWETGGDAAWFAQSGAGVDGGDAAVSGPIEAGEATWIETTIEGPGRLTFSWKADSTWHFNRLRFEVDGERRRDLSGDTGWRDASIDLGPGIRELLWTYSKTRESDSGENSVRLAEVEWEPFSNYVYLSPRSRRVGFDAEGYEIAVRSDSVWSVDLDKLPEWVDVSPAGGSGDGTVTVDLDVHPGVVQRRAVIEIGGEDHYLVQGVLRGRPFQIAEYVKREEGAADLTFVAEPGRDYRAEISKDLKDWMDGSLKVDGSESPAVQVESLRELQAEAIPPEGFAASGEQPRSAFWRIRTELQPEGYQLVPGGRVTLGDSSAANELLMHGSSPVETAESVAFFMARTPVTYREWEEVREWALENGYQFEGTGKRGADRDRNALEASSANDDHPVVSVSWYDALKWCNARSEKEGRTPAYYADHTKTVVYRSGRIDVAADQVLWDGDGYRLPTGTEWEKAARGGLRDKPWPWGDSDINPERANYHHAENEYGTVRAGSFPANAYGFYDMAGNVWEWIWDADPGPADTHPPGGEPKPLSASPGRMLRGGSWDSVPEHCRVSARFPGRPDFRDSTIGFRPVFRAP